MHAILLRPNWPATFRRAVRDADGQTVKILEFYQGKPVLLDDADFEVVRGDMGTALTWAVVDESGNPVNKPDYGKEQEQQQPSTKVSRSARGAKR